MASARPALQAFLDTANACALVEIIEAKGSTPRDKGTWMLVSADRIFGTIGGGQLEFMAIDKARMMVVHATSALTMAPARLSIPLGPEIGQCCGGRVEIVIRLADNAIKTGLLAAARSSNDRLPHVYLFGGGHVGHALAAAFSLLPVRTIVVETRPEALDGMPEMVEKRLTPMPEAVVRQAPSGSAFVVLTHDHALDFLIVVEALKRTDAAYVGMIGSQTKKATFRNWFLKNADGNDNAFSRLVSPIGGNTVKDKRPAVIAAMAAAEVMTALVAASVRSAIDV